MKKHFIILKISLIALFLTVAGVARSAVYYACVGTTFNMSPSLPGGSTAYWDVKDASGTSITNYPGTTAPTTFASAGTYTIYLMAQSAVSAGQCKSDPVEHKIYVLPAFTVAVTSSIAEYCENDAQAATLTGTVTRTSPPTGYTLPAGVVYKMDWYNAVDATGSNIGTNTVLSSANASNDVGTYALAAQTTVGDHYYTVRAAYDVASATDAGTFLGTGATGCVNFPTSSALIRVNAKPTQPTLTISATN